FCGGLGREGGGGGGGLAPIVLRDALAERRQQRIDPFSGQRRDRHRRTGKTAAGGNEVDLVGDQQRIGPGPRGGAASFRRVAAIEDEEPDLGLLGAAQRAAQAFLLDHVLAVAQTGGL